MDYQNENFEFEVPTRIIYRPNGVDTIGGIIADDYSFKKVMLVYGGKSLKSDGVYDRIVKSLNDKKIEFKE